MTQPLLIMLCTDKGSLVQSTILFWMDWIMVWHACSIPLVRDDHDDRIRVVRVYYPLQVFIIDWFIMFVNQTQMGTDLRYLLLQRVTYVCAKFCQQVDLPYWEIWMRRKGRKNKKTSKKKSQKEKVIKTKVRLKMKEPVQFSFFFFLTFWFLFLVSKESSHFLTTHVEFNSWNMYVWKIYFKKCKLDLPWNCVKQ